MKQTEVILNHLKLGPITDNTARYRYRINRLADVIYKLRGKGHDITTENVRVNTQYGKTVIGRYHLVSQQNP